VLLVLVVTLQPRAIRARPAALPPVTVQQLTARIPPRQALAMTGSELIRLISGMDEADRRQEVHDQLLAGNIPEFLRHLKPVRLTSREPGLRGHEAVIWVMPDYLAIGSDSDFVRIPMGLYTAVTVARSFGCVLPTRKMVDAIHRQADLRLKPIPMRPGRRMTSVDYLWRHNSLIEQQLLGQSRGELIAGHKKDVVLTNRLLRNARRVAIYGWHQGDGTPIQPLSTIHHSRYADYSHGVRLVSSTVLIDGAPRSLFDVLEDPALARLMSYERMIPNARQIMSLPFDPPAPAPASPSR
jgi:hypothetical protein